MVHLIAQPTKYKSPLYQTKYSHCSKENAITQVSKIKHTEIFAANKFWIEDESGKIILTSRQTKRLASISN